MDFAPSPEQIEICEESLRFARKELNESLIERDSDAKFSRAAWAKCAESGVQGLPFPQKYGGSEADAITTMMVMEALGYGSRDSGLIFSIAAQVLSVQMPIFEFGTDEQKEKYLSRMCSGEWIGAHAMSEPDSGSDAFSLRSTATRTDDGYILNGRKTFVTNAPVADLFLVFVTTNKAHRFMGVTAFLVERDFRGISVGAPISKMGLRTSPMADVILEDCLVPAENRIGGEGMGRQIFMSSMAWERSLILSCNLGAMERQLEECIEYARERRQFGCSIGKFQAVANKIVDMKIRLDTARLLSYRAASSVQQGTDPTLEAAIAKLYLSEAWVQSCLDAVQIFGGYGFTTEYELERDLRDAIGGRLYSGTSEIQRNIIAQSLGL